MSDHASNGLSPRHGVLRCALLAAVAASLHAQSPVLNNTADSAASARTSARSAAIALRSGDTASAHRQYQHATSVWPTQPAYLWTRARLAAAVGDSSDALTALRAFAALGMTQRLSGDRLLNRYAAHPMFSDVSKALAQNGAPIARSSVRATLPDSTLWPEGVDYDARSRRFFVASVRHRTVYVSERGGTRALWTGVRPNVGAILGVRVDPAGAFLWATTAGLPQMSGYTRADSSIAALLRIRISDGAIVDRWDLPPSNLGHTLGDLAIGPRGDVFVSDSRDPVLYRLRPGARSLERITHPLFRSLQGIAATPDGSALYVADYSHGILHIDLRTATVTRLADAPVSTTLGIDGLTWYRGSLIGVQNGVAPARVIRLWLDASRLRVTRQEVLDRNPALADEPTIGTLAGDTFVYVANSQWEKHDDAGVRLPNTSLSGTRLVGIPLRR